MGEVGVYREEDVFWSETSQAVGPLRTLARPAGGVAVVAGVVLGVEALSTGVHTVALVEQQGPQAHTALATRGAPTGSTGAVTHSASSMVV